MKSDKPVQRLWLNSMTNDAMREAFGQLRDGADLDALRDAAKSRSEADWIVGMNATRAATIRLRSSFDGAVSLGRVQTPTLAILARREEEIRSFVPEPYWLVDATFAARVGGPAYEAFYRPYAEKVWGIDPTELSQTVAKKRLSTTAPWRLVASAAGRADRSPSAAG